MRHAQIQWFRKTTQGPLREEALYFCAGLLSLLSFPLPFPALQPKTVSHLLGKSARHSPKLCMSWFLDLPLGGGVCVCVAGGGRAGDG